MIESLFVIFSMELWSETTQSHCDGCAASLHNKHLLKSYKRPSTLFPFLNEPHF